MNFLQPAALWAILAGLLIIIAYLLRMPRRRQLMPSTLIVALMQQFTRRERRKLRTLLSFLAIALAFLATSFNAGRPYTTSAEDNERHDHIVVLDVSASMKSATKAEQNEGVTVITERRFDKAKEKARELVNSLQIGQRMMIITVGQFAQIARNFESDIQLLEETLEGIHALDTGTNWDDASRLLREILPTASSPICYLLTDADNFNVEQWSDLPEDTNWRLYQPTPPKRPEGLKGNVAITNFRARTTFHSDRDFQIIAEVQNFADEKVDLDLDLYLDDLLVDTHPISLGPGESKTEVLSQTLRVGGVLIGRLAVAGSDEIPFPDELDIDNAASDVVPSPLRPKVLIYSDDNVGFLHSALSANSNALAYSQKPSNYSPDYAADIFLFYNITDLPGELPPKDVIFVNTTAKAIPVKVQKEFENPMMRTWNRHHPLMNYLSLSNLLIAKSQGFTVPGWAETLAETASGPLIIAGESPERQMAFIGLDPSDSDLPFRVALPMLVSNALLWMKERAPDPEPIQPGETWRVEIDESDTKVVELALPDGTKSVHEVQPDGSVVFLDTFQSGIYRYETFDQSGAFTVHLKDSEESSLKKPAEVRVAGKAVEKMEERKSIEVRRYWPALAVIALGLLIAENSLYHRRIWF
ncbi:MAG: BatA and WFA domain-containing protein [Planctomycetota bacterium]|jgi:hypothetical protein|nr:BatA and WFA domain-containing protein [Planctomycetota bacterium]